MNLKINLSDMKVFVISRLFELLSLIILTFSLFITISLISYSPTDPNFIYSADSEVKNFFGIYGSFISDFLFQSIGFISFLIPVTFLSISIHIFKKKKAIILLNNSFYIVCYSLIGSLFLTRFYKISFLLPFNGSGGFVGTYLNTLFNSISLSLDNQVTYFSLLLITTLLFLLSINFRLIWLSFFTKLFKRNKKIKNEISEESFTEVDREEKIQESLPLEYLASKEKVVEKKFQLPKIDFLNSPKSPSNTKENHERIDAKFLEKVLLDFGVEGKIKNISSGPVVTLNEFEPAAGVKVSKVVNLSEDIARNTSSESARISIIPGSSSLGIELPNTSRDDVMLKEIIESKKFNSKDIKLPIALGKSISGNPIISDLTSMPHLLIAGTTGSGKSVCINTIILSLMYRLKPDLCKFILIDPKMLELSTYEGVPHLLCPVITEAKKAASVLGWVVREMENRYKLMTKVGVRNIDGYNTKHKVLMPYIVVVVDEMSDLMLVASKDIENYIQKLSQMARAAGIHIIMATQRPSVDVITGTIKANFPTRISFQVSSKIDSRTILGEQGAEQLLGKGDMLFMSSANKITRIHAPFVSEGEIEKINNFLRSQATPEYVEEILNMPKEKSAEGGIKDAEADKDELYEEALKIILSEKKASTSFLQRKLQIGYNRAARIIDSLEENGIVSRANHVGKREVLK